MTAPVGPYDFDFPETDMPQAKTDDDSLAVRIGKICFWSSGFIGSFAVAASSLTRKKQRIMQIQGSNGAPPPAEVVIEQPEPPPAGARHLPDLSHEDQQRIQFVVTSLATKTTPELIQLKGKLEEIDVVLSKNAHPFQFLGYIFSTPATRDLMPAVFGKPASAWSLFDSSVFTRNGFLSGVKKGMNAHANNLEPFIHSFSEKVRTTPQNIRPFIQKQDWFGLVKHLIERCCPR